MKNAKRLASLLASAAVLALPLSASTISADAATPGYSSCAQLHKKYAHGVGKNGAKDKVSGHGKPVTDFTHSTKVYKAVIKKNKGLDRDHDGIACEAH